MWQAKPSKYSFYDECLTNKQMMELTRIRIHIRFAKKQISKILHTKKKQCKIRNLNHPFVKWLFRFLIFTYTHCTCFSNILNAREKIKRELFRKINRTNRSIRCPARRSGVQCEKQWKKKKTKKSAHNVQPISTFESDNIFNTKWFINGRQVERKVCFWKCLAAIRTKRAN